MLRHARRDRSGSPGAHSAARGFTLIEMLVVVTIVGILSVSVALSIAPDARRTAKADVQRLALLLEAAMLEGQAGRRQLAMSANAEGYSFWVAENTPQLVRNWQPLTDDENFHARRLSAGLHIVRIDIDGQPLPEGALLIFRRGDPPLFRIALEGAASMPLDPVELRSLPNGRVEMRATGSGQ
jgi:prepilin-type N-terminal cleavage/methylation domain-containing protein